MFSICELNHIVTQPIPLELLTATGFDDPPQPRSSRLHLRTIAGTLSAADSAAGNATNASAGPEKLLYPITFNCLGRQGGFFTLFVESSQARLDWKQKLQDAIGLREAVLESDHVFDLVTMSEDTFVPRSISLTDSHRRDGTVIPYGRPTCSVAFSTPSLTKLLLFADSSLATPERHQLVAIGHEEGLWIGLRQDPQSYRLVLHLKGITQAAVLQD